MTGIKWEDPPQRKTGGRPAKYVAFFDALRKKPGKWALFAEEAPGSIVTQIHRGRFSGTSPSEFEATARLVPGTKRGTIYVRYVGGAK